MSGYSENQEMFEWEQNFERELADYQLDEMMAQEEMRKCEELDNEKKAKEFIQTIKPMNFFGN